MKKLRKGLIGVGLLGILYGIGVVAIIGITHWFDLFAIIVGAGIVGIGLSAPFLKVLPKILNYVLCAIVILVVTVFSLMEIAIIAEGQRAPEPDAAYVIVLGAKVNGTQPSFALARRIEAAADYMFENPQAIAIGAGGRGQGEFIAEGEAIALRLEALGIDPSRIQVENQSTTTKENLVYSLRIIEESSGDANSKVVIVSSSYHVFRAKKLAEKIGYKNISTEGCSSKPYLNPHYYVREFVALIKERMDRNI